MGEGAQQAEQLLLRRATEDDRSAVIELCRASLGWEADDPNEAFFAWKHDENPFGASPAWVAEAPDGTLAGLRVFMRWGFRGPEGTRFGAVRAVDTATHPDWQGKGIFTKLTLGALPDLRDEGVDFVFNTPNDKSRPGYLKMGWQQVGRVPVSVRLASPSSARVLAGARTAADMWSRESSVGFPASEVFADHAAVGRLLDRFSRSSRMVTDRTPEFLDWRYRFGPLRYRALLLGSSVEDGIVVFRVRGRGAATECAVCDVIAPPGVSPRRAMRTLASSGADYLLRCSGVEAIRDGFLPAPQLGPILTWRPITRTGVPSMRELSLVLGDVELF